MIVQLTEGEWSDRAPTWSPDGSRLAFVSDRIKRGHFLPYVMPAGGGEPRQVGALQGTAESVSWSTDGRRLLVGAADAGSYSHEASAVAVVGAGDDPDPIVYRRGRAYRRLFLVDVETGDTAEVGPPGPVRVGVGLGRGRDGRRGRVGGPDGERLVRREDRAARPRGPHGDDAAPARVAGGGPRALAGRAARRDRRGLLERPRAAERQRDRRRHAGRRRHRPVAGLRERRRRRVERRRLARGTADTTASAPRAGGCGSTAGTRSRGPATRTSATRSASRSRGT